MACNDFSSLPLHTSLLDNLPSLGYLTMTPVQTESLPKILKSQDVIVQAKTGSGKTAAFGLGILNGIDPAVTSAAALILCPTRELAEQVAAELRRLARCLPNIRIVTLCGGSPYFNQRNTMEHGAHIVVGTPGRIDKHIRKNSLITESIRTLVLDEADRLLDMGFYDSIMDIIKTVPNNRQTMLFSATFPDAIIDLSTSIQRNAKRISVDTMHEIGVIKQRAYLVEKDAKIHALIQILLHHNPPSSVVFCNTKQTCKDVAKALKSRGFSVTAIHGDLDQRDRNVALTLFTGKSISVLVATDVASRGIDVKDLSAVINYDLSPDAEVHVHRIGRTGRAGKEGLAISLYQETQEFRIKLYEEYMNQPIERTPLPAVSNANPCNTPPTISFHILGGKKSKIRPGDILGALTGEAGIPGSSVGKIHVFDQHSYVAIAKNDVAKVEKWAKEGTIKRRRIQRM